MHDNPFGELLGLSAVDRNNVRLGSVDAIVGDMAGGTWLVVRLQSQVRTPIPMDHVTREKDHLKIAYDERTVSRAPAWKPARQKLARDEVVRLDTHYRHELPEGLYRTPLEVAQAYAQEEVTEEFLVKELSTWTYVSHVPAVRTETVDVLDDPPVWRQGTVHDLEVAVDRNLISIEIYGAILAEMRSLRAASGANRGGDDSGQNAHREAPE
ncbi:hypothetical protein [Streptomyces sp. NPDC058548]|uniref:hypothetical protein n=1 Tax=Streptomyces sp. NPDC058548 TaxID=3346545 RepID=UPI00365B8168